MGERYGLKAVNSFTNLEFSSNSLTLVEILSTEFLSKINLLLSSKNLSKRIFCFRSTLRDGGWGVFDVMERKRVECIKAKAANVSFIMLRRA